MENAAKALLIAGGILIALVIISTGIIVYTRTRDLHEYESAAREEEQVRKFNQEYTAYDKKELRGIEIITITNKAINNNVQNPENPITIEVRINRTDILDGLQPNNYIFTGSALNTYNNLKQNETSFKLFKEQRFFKCVSNQTEFENENGIISKMVFEEIEIEARGE